MLIGEVKEGHVGLNRAMHDPAVLASALVRFGCCEAEQALGIVRTMLSRGSATTPGGHRIRMVMFGSTPGGARRGVHVIAMGHVVAFLQSHIQRCWDLLHQVQSKDPVFGFLLTLEKAGRGTTTSDSRASVPKRVRP